jgi:hypothetical protein
MAGPRGPIADEMVIGAYDAVEGKVVKVPSHHAISENIDISEKVGEIVDSRITTAPVEDESPDNKDDNDTDSDGAIIRTGADAARYLLPMRDDFDPALTFRGIFLATCLSAFQAVMNQIYAVSLYLCWAS